MTRRRLADTRAAVARAQSTTTGAAPVRLHPDPWEGLSAFAVGQIVVLMPTLAADAPKHLHTLYEAKIVANAQGRCSECDAVASVPTSTLIGLEHDAGCALSRRWSPAESHHLDARGVTALAVLAAQSANDDRRRR